MLIFHRFWIVCSKWRLLEVCKSPRHYVAILELRRVGDRLEEPPPHDLEPLLGACRRHEESTRPTTLRSRSSASRPRWPPTSTLSAWVCGEPPVSEAGRLITRQAVLCELGRLGQHLGKGELRLESTRGQVALVVELARVGHPLVDQDQAGPILLEKLTQRIPRAGRLLVVGLDPGKGLLAAKLPGELPP